MYDGARQGRRNDRPARYSCRSQKEMLLWRTKRLSLYRIAGAASIRTARPFPSSGNINVRIDSSCQKQRQMPQKCLCGILRNDIKRLPAAGDGSVGALSLFSCRSIILLYILPQLIRQYFCIFTNKDLCGVFISLQLPEHPCGHITVCALLHVAVFSIYTASTHFCKTVGQCVVDFLQSLQRRDTSVLFVGIGKCLS